jgi:hypothetical protein
VALLRRHMRKPKYGEYHVCTCPKSRTHARLLFGPTHRCCRRRALTPSCISCTPVFTNILKDSFLHELADADDGEIIKQVQVRSPPRPPECANAGHTALARDAHRQRLSEHCAGILH